MQARILISLALLLSFFSSSAWADDGYIGEDLWNDIYKRIDEGIYKVKKQLIENRLKGSADRLNTWIGPTCATSGWGMSLCLRSGADFTVSELDDIAGGGVGAIYTHLNQKVDGVSTDQMTRMSGIITEHYQDLQSQVTEEQQKLQSVGSIGLFADGNKDNSSYDLMVDLQNIHAVLFAKDIPYNGTDNMGAPSLANLLGNAYAHPFLPLNPFAEGILPPFQDPGVSVIPPTDSAQLPPQGSSANGSGCITPDQAPKNLDPNFLSDVQSQLLVGVNPNSSMAFGDDGKLPEYWAKVAQGTASPGGSMGRTGPGVDKFPCSGKDIFCVLLNMENYSQNILWGWKADTIEKVLDNNLKIVDKFAPSSFIQSKMTRNFFQLSLKNLNLPSIFHMGTVVSRLPPPLLNFKPGTTGGEEAGEDSKPKEDEFNAILVNTFEEMGLDFKRQNSLEQNNTSLAINNCTYLSTDGCAAKQSGVGDTPQKSWYIRAKEMEFKKSYGDSFNDDLFELHDFTLAFTKQIETITSIIKGMHEIPQK